MHKIFNKIILFILLILLPITSYAAEQSVVAIVGSKAITDVDLSKRMQLVARTNNMPNIISNRDLKLHILKMLIDEQLIAQRAEQLKIKVDEMDLKEAKETIAKRNSISTRQLENQLASTGIDVNELEKQITHQLLWSKIITNQIEPNISVSDLEIKNAKIELPVTTVVKQKKIKQNEKFRIAEIEIIYEDEKSKKEARATANSIYDQLQKKGSDFAKLANDFSQGANASKGGELGGWFTTAQLSSLYSNALLGKTKGNITKPLDSGQSIVILKVLDHIAPKEAEVISAPTTLAPKVRDEDAIREIIRQKKFDSAVKSYLKKMHDQAYVDIKLIK